MTGYCDVLGHRHAVGYKVYHVVYTKEFSEDGMIMWENAYNIHWKMQDKKEDVIAIC